MPDLPGKSVQEGEDQNNSVRMEKRRPQFSRILTGSRSPVIGDLMLFRILPVVMSVILLLGWVFHSVFIPASSDSLSARLILIGLLISFSVSTFLSRFARQNAQVIFSVLFSVCSLWILVLNFQNGFNISYSIGLFFIYLIFAVSFRSLKLLALYSVIMVCLPVMGILFSDQPFEIKSLYITLILVVMITGGILLGIKMTYQSENEIKALVLSAIFNESSDFLILADPESLEILGGNNLAVKTFGINVSDRNGQKLPGFFACPESWDRFSDLNLFDMRVHHPLKEFWADISVKPVKSAEQPFLLVRLTDISQKKGAEETAERFAIQRKRLLETAGSMLTMLSLEDIFKQISTALSEITHYNLCALFWTEPNLNSFKPIAVVKKHQDAFPMESWTVQYGKGLIGSIIQEGKSQMINNCHLDPRSIYPAGYIPEKEHSIIIPVRVKGEIQGIFTVTRNSDDVFSADDFELIQLFITHSIAAIQNGILFEEANRRARHSQSLMEVTKAIISTFEVDQLLDMIVEKVLELTQSQHGALFLLNETTGILSIGASRGISPEVIPLMKFPVGDSIAGYVAQTGRGMLIQDVQSHPRFRMIPQLEQFVSMISIPLISKGRVIGVMGVDRLQGEKFFQDTDFKIAQDFADQAVLALENARLFNQINQSEKKYRTLFEESEDAVFVSSLDGKFQEINPAGVSMFGYESREEFLKMDISRDLYFSQDERNALVDRILRDGFVRNFEITLKKKNGSPVTVVQSTNLVRDENGNAVFLRGIIRDITEQRKLQHQLFQSQKMESLGQLAGGMAHDFNNILGGIMGYASFMKSQLGPGSPFIKYVESVEKGAERAAGLIARLLAFARGGKSTPIAVNLNQLAAESLSIMERTFDKSIELNSVLHPAIQPVLGDPVQLQQVIINLCVNARDAISGKGIIEIETHEMSFDSSAEMTTGLIPPGNYVVLSVSDTGTGMESEILSRIFEPFFSTKETGKGTGLGLAMVYGVLQNHQAFLNVTSSPGVGSRFDVFFPAMNSALLPAPDASPEPGSGPDGAGVSATGCILVVDDDESIRELASDILRHFGYEVLTATDGLDSLSVFEASQDKISLVLMDVMMPRMSGIEAFQALKSIKPEVPVIFSSGYSENDALETLVQDGLAGFIAKPYHVGEFIRIIQDYLSDK